MQLLPRSGILHWPMRYIGNLLERTNGSARRDAYGRVERPMPSRAVHRLVRELARANEAWDIAQILADVALDAVDGSGAYVERTGTLRSSAQVIGAAGSGVPRVGTRLTRHARTNDGTAGHIISVPLRCPGERIGTLVLVRGPQRAPFTDGESALARILADIGAFALQRCSLLEEFVRVTEDRAQLLRGFSHDVKNPLGAALGLAEMLKTGLLGTLDDRQADAVSRIHASLRSALDLIDDVLDLARVEVGAIELERTTVDVAPIVRDLVERHRAQASTHGLVLGSVYTSGPTRAVCDPKRTSQVLGNLIGNAIKYTPHGRVDIEVTSRDAGPLRGGPWVAIAVRDTGPGIPAGERQTIFGEFTRLDEEGAPGAGIGLSISRRVARLMGGDITVEAADGGGSVFTLWLPADGRRPMGASTAVRRVGSRPA